MLRVAQAVGRPAAALAGGPCIVPAHLPAGRAHVISRFAEALRLLRLLRLTTSLLPLQIARELLGLLPECFLLTCQALELPLPLFFRDLLLCEPLLLAREVVLPARELPHALLQLALSIA